ncbi:MAG: hypothetical protein U9Q07_06770, partial [Planctomycetota bacterium]|nr:hypothetical protein [Planctomycetota bacterium]
MKANGRGLQLTSMSDYKEFALCVAKSGMAPRSLDTPEKVLVAVQTGAELEHLLHLPDKPYDASIIRPLTASKQALISFDGNRYSVP